MPEMSLNGNPPAAANEAPPASQTKPAETRTAREIAQEYADVLAAREKVNAESRRIAQRLGELDREVRDWCSAQGVEAIKGSGITLRVEQKPVVRVGDWDRALRWIVEEGLSPLVQKRITASRLQELVVGGLPLPDDLSLEEIEKVAYSRGEG